MAKKTKYFIGGAVAITLMIILSSNLILVKNAYSLDENYKRIGKVTSIILNQDNNWIGIPENYYLRIQFERKLNKSNDILIYAKGNGSVEVYKKGAKTKIAEFQNISEPGFYRIYLTSMTGVDTDTFDLKSKGNIFYDYVVDPKSEKIIEYEKYKSNSGEDSTSSGLFPISKGSDLNEI